MEIAVLGAGLIGRRHIGHVLAQPGATLAAIVDPADAARVLAAENGVPWHADLASMLRHLRPDAAIVATPNQMHLAHGLATIAAGLPTLMEKPLADSVAAATTLVEAAEAAGVPLLTGHHRRHNPIVQAAKAAIDQGRLGQLVSAHATCWFHKPDTYFDTPWRRQPGAGPVIINLVHDIDLLRMLCGEVVEVHAMESAAQRGHAVEDTAVVLLRFANGVLATLTVSDTIVSPWSWEFTAGENPAYSRTNQACILIGGTLGALSIPYLDLWRHETAPDWFQPILNERLPAVPQDPLALQVLNLCAVVRGTAAPVVSGRDGLDTLRVVEAVKQAAATGQPVRTMAAC